MNTATRMDAGTGADSLTGLFKSFVLPFAIDKRAATAVRPREDSIVRLLSTSGGEGIVEADTGGSVIGGGAGFGLLALVSKARAVIARNATFEFAAHLPDHGRVGVFRQRQSPAKYRPHGELLQTNPLAGPANVTDWVTEGVHEYVVSRA